MNILKSIIVVGVILLLTFNLSYAHDIKCPRGTYDTHSHVFSGGLDCTAYRSSYDKETKLLRCEGVEIVKGDRFPREVRVVNGDLRWDGQCFQLETVEDAKDR